jgi:hypothetical protein
MVGIYKTEIEQNKIEIDEESMAEPVLLESLGTISASEKFTCNIIY